MNKHLPTCFKLGLIGNIFFILFGVICIFYYESFKDTDVVILPIEIMAYTSEAIGFICLLLSEIWFCRLLRHRYLMKFAYFVYIIMEMALMIMELNSYRIDFYEPYSIVWAIGHSVISAAICFTFLALDPTRTKYEVMVIIAVAMMLFGMIGSLLHIRLYFGIVANAISYIFLFSMILYFLSREEMDIDCKGDVARVYDDYSKNTFFK